MEETIASPTVYLFAGHNQELNGGGGIAAQLARAYVRAGYNVLYLSYDSPNSPVVRNGITEVSVNRCDFGRMKFDMTEHDILHAVVPCPIAYRVLEDFGGRAVYHALDNWDVWVAQANYRWTWPWYTPGLEAKFIRDSDISYAVSPALAGYLGVHNVLSNAYDPCIFKWVDHKPPVRRAVMWGYSAGYANTNLISDVARLTPDVEYVLIGRRTTSPPIAHDITNVLEVGAKTIGQLPAIAQNSQVGLVFRYGEVAEYMCPTKSWEYLGSGLRFVSAGYDYPNSGYNPACAVSPTTDPQDVADTITNVYELIPELTEEQAIQHTWDRRIAQVRADIGHNDVSGMLADGKG